MTAPSNDPSSDSAPQGERTHDDADGGSRSAAPANGDAPAEETNPEKMDRDTLERRIRGANRRAKIPGSIGKKAREEYHKLEATFKRRFKGAVRRFWDSVPPPPRNRTNS